MILFVASATTHSERLRRFGLVLQLVALAAARDLADEPLHLALDPRPTGVVETAATITLTMSRAPRYSAAV